MQGKNLMVLEVSQKQSYIFNEKHLQNNIMASNTIVYVTSADFFTKKFPDLFSEEENLIYSGGGHTFLIFADDISANTFAKSISYYVLKEFPGLELFISTIKYNTDITPAENIKALTNALEEKKGIRKASFYQTTFGVERSGRRMSLNEGNEDGSMRLISPTIQKDVKDSIKQTAKKTLGNSTVDVETPPKNYEFPAKFEYIGGEKGKNNFIAVIHIDGNQMGARVKGLQKFIDKDEEKIGKKLNKLHPEYSADRNKFEIWKYYSRKFSESIDFDFKKALMELYKDLEYNLKMPKDQSAIHTLTEVKEQENTYLPIRKIIAAGDDICLVTEGRIGLECAERFIYHLEQQQNAVDKGNYYACAGVAIVHQKYPFYRAYDMAEQLCSNAKKVMAKKAQELNKKIGTLSAIDWHVEYGEMQGSLDDIRENMKPEYPDTHYDCLYNRPYQITECTDLLQQNMKIPVRYEGFRNLQLALKGFKGEGIPDLDIPKHKQKEMRNAIKTGYEEYRRFITMNSIQAENLDLSATAPELFDALETGDLFLPLERRPEK